MRTVFVATPIHNSYVHSSMHYSMLAATGLLARHDINLCSGAWTGSSLLPDVRNILLAKVLADTDATDVVFIDSDVSFDPDCLLRLLSHPVDFVAGIYRHKKADESYPVNFLDKPRPQNGPLIEVQDVPMGFTRITRMALLRMNDAYRDRVYTIPATGDLQIHALFDVPYVPGLGIHGEDYGFCKRWRDIGGKVWVDPDMKLTHHGDHAFVGHLGNWLNAQRPKETT